MQIINNGMIKEINVLKHFKINIDEYILYEYLNTVLLGQIIENKIYIPSNDKMETIMIIIGNFINNNNNVQINAQYNCIILDNQIPISLEEINAQPISLTDVQLNILRGNSNTIMNNNTQVNPVNNVNNLNNTNNVDNTPKKRNPMVPILITIIIILSLFLVGFIFKDKIPFISGNNSNGFGSGTSKSVKKLSPEEALEKAYEYAANNDYNGFMNTMPSALREYYKSELSESEFSESIGKMSQEVGSNFTITTNVTTNKMDDSWIENNNKFLKEQFGPDVKMTECYEYHGTVTIKGSIGVKELTDKDLYETWYCKVNDEWGFVFG